jgi:poly(3-hydroxybutyrate) depolymerase
MVHEIAVNPMLMKLERNVWMPILFCFAMACTQDSRRTDRPTTDAGSRPGQDAAPISPDGGAMSTDATGPQMDGSTQPSDAGSGAPTGCGRSQSEPDGMQTVDVNGLQRSYIVTLPSNYDANQPHKLIFVWHGRGGTAQQTAITWGYHGIRPQADGTAIFVAGQGIEDGQGRIGWGHASDIPVVEAMIDKLTGLYCVDESRIYSSGHSYGGYMSNRVGCLLGSRFRAITPVMGGGPQFGARPPSCTGKVASWITHGRNDTVVQFSQGQESRDYWRTANGCDETSTETGVGECVSYDNCDDGYPVVWCPSNEQHRPPSYAPQAMWNFIAQF